MTDVDRKKRVLIVDDHPVVRRGLRELLEDQEDFRVAGEAASEVEALDLAGSEPLDLALVDVSLQNGNGVELVKQLQNHHKKLPVLVISMHDERLYAERALAAGARGYVMKQAGDEEILRAVRRVLGGRFYLSGGTRERLFPLEAGELSEEGGETPVERLSDRELEVFLLVGQGYAPRHLAEELNLSVKTVETHRRHIRQKLDLESASELVRYAIAWSKEKATESA
jgi:DNA-binding NarL/FixJ family response regulator